MRNRVIIGFVLAAIVVVAYFLMAKRENPPAPTIKPAVEQQEKPAKPIKVESARVQVAGQNARPQEDAVKEVDEDDVANRLRELGYDPEKVQAIEVR